MEQEKVDPRALFEQAQNAYEQGDYSAAQPGLEQALDVFLNDKDYSAALGAATLLGNIASILNNPSLAIDRSTLALELARRIEDKYQEVIALNNLGVVHARLDQNQKAIEYFEQAHALARKLDDRRSEAIALSNLGNSYAGLKELRKAIEFYEQALAIHREIGDRRSEAYDLNRLGNAYASLGNAEKAIEFFQNALALYRETGDRSGEARTMFELGQVYQQRGDVNEAKRFIEQSLGLYKELQDTPNINLLEMSLEEIQKGTGAQEVGQTQQGEQEKEPQKQSKASPGGTAPSAPTIAEEISAALSASSRQAIRIAENLRRQIDNPEGSRVFTEYLLIGLNELSEEAPRALLVAFGLDRSRIVASLASQPGR
jgi:tetratricopeptide (TPR) repeat protein